MNVYGFGWAEILVLSIVPIVAYVMAIKLFIDLAKNNGFCEDGGSGKLWFIGIFTTPIVIGIYVLALINQKK